jgi:LysM repeat protein
VNRSFKRKISLIGGCRALPFVFLLLLSLNTGLRAQDIKKSTRIEKTGDRKYYIHTVEQGQTLYAIAKAYALEVNDIIVENPEAIDGIKPGQELKIPYLKSLKNNYEVTKPRIHKTEAGQTLYSIAKLYGVTIESIQKMNPELKDGLKAGQVLKIPAAQDQDTTEKPKEKVADSGNNTAPVKPQQEFNVPPVKEDTKPAEAKDSKHVADLPSNTDTSFAYIKKDKYRVALFAPFHADYQDNLDVDRISRDMSTLPPKTEQAIQFYQGFRLAMDSVKKSGVNIQLTVYDVDDADTIKIQQILKKTELAEMDLVVGPLSPNSFLAVSRFSKQHNIPIVSPISQQNRILLNNEYVSKMVPSVTTQLEEEANFIFKKYPGQNVILINNPKEGQKEGQYAGVFHTRYAELFNGNIPSDLFHELKGIEGLTAALQTGKANVFVIPSNNLAYVTDILRMLNTLLDKDSIVVFGMQSWSNFSNLDFDYLDNLSLHYAANSFIDYDSEGTANFIKNYRILTSSEPSTIAFQGYDAGYYYLKAIGGYGTNFYKRLPRIKWTGTQGSFDMYKTSPESGYENKAVNIVMIRDYKLIRADK